MLAPLTGLLYEPSRPLDHAPRRNLQVIESLDQRRLEEPPDPAHRTARRADHPAGAAVALGLSPFAGCIAAGDAVGATGPCGVCLIP
jgi:hypothetical protein